MSESESASSAAIAESAARRLREALEKIAAGTLDECPVMSLLLTAAAVL
jgi:hypothetical protein